MRKITALAMPALMALALCREDAGAWDIGTKYEGEKTVTTDTAWHSDILPGYEARYVNQGIQFDGPCRSTIVRMKCRKPSRKGYLYIHGFNDYFFQSEMGKQFVDSGYHFYAVDLRRYGRSKEPWQYPYNIRDIRKYYDDIDSAVVQMKRDGIDDITLGGHSTGGLTAICYGIDKGDGVAVNRIVTDSPFLDWNLNSFHRNFLAPGIRNLSVLIKNVKVPQGHCDGYAYSLLKEYYGEWTYNTDWKMIYSPPVTFSWVGQIQSAHNKAEKHGDRLAVPVLIMHSSRKVNGCGYEPDFRYGDAVLDPHRIQKAGMKIKRKSRYPVEVCTIDSGLHDLILSHMPFRQAAYDSIFSFIRRHSR